MASLFINALEQVGKLQKTDDDLIDRLNHRFTVLLLVTFTAFVSAKQFIGEPISCWTPAQFSGPQVAYTNSICWLKGTYYLETDKQSIPHRTQNSQFHIAYYQFVPYMLLVMAVLFYLPHMFWRNISRYLGFDLRKIIQNVKTTSKKDIDKIGLEIHRALQYNSPKNIVSRDKSNRLFDLYQYPHRHREIFSMLSGHRLTLLYIFVKILYLINCLGQFYILSSFLSFPFYKFGIEWLLTMSSKIHNRVNHNQSNDSKWFPRVVMCDFMVRHLGSNQHWMSIQCNLPINLFNELIFVILWMWFVFLGSLTLISFILSIISICTNIGHEFIRKHLPKNLSRLERERVDDFVKNYLKWDGVLVLRIIAFNTNDVIMGYLVCSLHKIYSNSIEKEKKKSTYDHHLEVNGLYARSDGTYI